MSLSGLLQPADLRGLVYPSCISGTNQRPRCEEDASGPPWSECVCDADCGVKSFLRSWRPRKTFLLGIPRFYQGAVSKSPRGGVGAPSGAGTHGETWNPSEGPAPARRSQSRSTGLQTCRLNEIPHGIHLSGPWGGACAVRGGPGFETSTWPDNRVLFRPRLNERIQKGSFF